MQHILLWNTCILRKFILPFLKITISFLNFNKLTNFLEIKKFLVLPQPIRHLQKRILFSGRESEFLKNENVFIYHLSESYTFVSVPLFMLIYLYFFYFLVHLQRVFPQINKFLKETLENSIKKWLILTSYCFQRQVTVSHLPKAV